MQLTGGASLGSDGDRNLQTGDKSLDKTAMDAMPGDKQAKGADDGSSDELTAMEEREVARLEKRDREVHVHEQAHVNAGATNATYKYERGPDGERYATGGHAQIDTSMTGEPEKDIEKAKKIRRAAMAPVDPSPQDRKVAAEADQMERQARAKLAEEQEEEAAKRGQAGGGASPVRAQSGGPIPTDGYEPTSGQTASSIDILA